MRQKCYPGCIVGDAGKKHCRLSEETSVAVLYFEGNNTEVIVRSFRCAVENQTKGSIMDISDEEYQN